MLLRRAMVEKQERAARMRIRRGKLSTFWVISENQKRKKTFYTSFIPYCSTQTFYQWNPLLKRVVWVNILKKNDFHTVDLNKWLKREAFHSYDLFHPGRLICAVSAVEKWLLAWHDLGLLAQFRGSTMFAPMIEQLETLIPSNERVVDIFSMRNVIQKLVAPSPF